MSFTIGNAGSFTSLNQLINGSGSAYDFFLATNSSVVGNAVAATAAVPEPATWGMMILGFGMMGAVLRRRVRASEVRFDARIKRIAGGAAWTARSPRR